MMRAVLSILLLIQATYPAPGPGRYYGPPPPPSIVRFCSGATAPPYGGPSAVTFTLPGDVAAGDFAIVTKSSQLPGLYITTGSARSWTSAWSLGTYGQQISEGYTQTLNSADVAAGSITADTGDSFGSIVSLTIFIGSHSIQNVYNNINSYTALPVTVSAPTTNIYIGVARTDGSQGTVTVNLGTLQGSAAHSLFFYGSLYAQVSSVSGTFTPGYTFSAGFLYGSITQVVVQ